MTRGPALACLLMAGACSNVCDDLAEAQLRCPGVLEPTVARQCDPEETECVLSFALMNRENYCRVVLRAYEPARASSMCSGGDMGLVNLLCELDRCKDPSLSLVYCIEQFEVCQ